MEWLLYILPAGIVLALIFFYGRGRELIGKLKEISKGNKAQNEREENAKEIESEPPPNTASDVADVFSKLHSHSRKTR